MDPEYHEEMEDCQKLQYNECIQRLQENSSLTFEFGILKFTNKSAKNGQNNLMWQEFVRIKNPEYQNLIDKIVYRVDFCVDQTNLMGIKEPFTYMTDDFLF